MRRPNSPPPRRSQDTRPVSPQPVPTLRRSSSDVSHPRKRLLAKLKNAGGASSSSNASSTNTGGGGSSPASKQFLPSHSRTGSNPALSPSAPSPTNSNTTAASKPGTSPSKTRDMHSRLGTIPAQVGLVPGIAAAASASSLSLASTATLTSNATTPGSSTTDPWHRLHVHVLPLFNGEALRMPIEALNILVQDHISAVVSRSLSRAISTLEQDVVAFLAAGMVTINVKLSELDDEKLLPRVIEIWEFFWHQVLPYVEGVFHPLQTHTLVRTLTRTPKTHRPSSPKLPDETLLMSTQHIDVRTLALRSFRDSIILPIYPRLHALLTPSRKEKDATTPRQTYNHPRLQQMLLVLVSTAQHPHSLAEPLSPSQGEGAVSHLLRDIRSPQSSVPARPFSVNRLPSFFSGSAPRDRRGRIARKTTLKVDSSFRNGDDDWQEETPRNTGFTEHDRERQILESLRSPELDFEEPSVEGGAGGWGLGRGQEGEHLGEEDDDDEPADWDQAQNVVERMIGLRG